MIHVELGDTFSCDRRFAREEDGCSTAAMVYDGQDGVRTLGWGELSDEIEADRLEGESVRRRRNPELRDSLGMVARLVLLAVRASLNVGGHPFRQVRPPEYSFHHL